MNLKQLRARLAAIRGEMQGIVSTAEGQENGLMTQEQKDKFDGLKAEFDQVKDQIAQKESMDAINAHVDASAGRNAAPTSPEVTSSEGRVVADPWCGFRDAGEFAMAVRNANPHGASRVDERLTAMAEIMAAPSNVHVERGSDEGYMVPPAMRDAIWNVVDSTDDLLSMVDSEPTSSNSVTMLADESTPWGSTGIQAYWAGEQSQFTASKLATQARTINLHKLYAFTNASDELLDDAPRLANRLTQKAGLAIAWKMSNAIIYGDGVGKPLGYFQSGALVTQAKKSGQSAATFVAENVGAMAARLKGGSLQRAVWLMNPDVLPQLMQLTIGDQPVWTPPVAGLTGAPGGYLLGRPIIFSEHCKTLGTVGDVMLIDPKGYYAPRKTGTKFARSIHLYFDYDVEAFRWTFRFGGQPYLSAPVSAANGSNSKSHFVALATRS